MPAPQPKTEQLRPRKPVAALGVPEIGARVRLFRQCRRISQLKLAALTGIYQPSLSDIESGKTLNPRIETIAKIADALEVSVNTLLGCD